MDTRPGPGGGPEEGGRALSRGRGHHERGLGSDLHLDVEWMGRLAGRLVGKSPWHGVVIKVDSAGQRWGLLAALYSGSRSLRGYQSQHWYGGTSHHSKPPLRGDELIQRPTVAVNTTPGVAVSPRRRGA